MEGIAAVARERGHRTWAAFGRKGQPGPTETYQISNLLDYAAHGIYSLALDSHGLGSTRATKRFLRWLEEFLVPVLQPGDVVVMDNASFHKSLAAQMNFECTVQSSLGLLFI